MILVVFILFLLVTIVSLLWANAIENEPKDYKGEDFLNEE
jgi:hypothetical protein